MPQYTHTSLDDSITALSLRLDDSTLTYWSRAELTAYIIEALRTWQSLTAFYRERNQFPTVANQSFYDLTTTGLLPTGVFDYNITDRDQIAVILYHLLEAQLSGGFTWAGTEQFNLPQVVNALQSSINQFLADTGCVLTHVLHATVLSLPSGRITLPDTLYDIRRAAWSDPDGNFTTLWRADEYAINAFKQGWSQNPEDPPQVYSVAVTPPVSIQIAPIPANSGQLDLCVSKSGQIFDPASLATLLSIPDDLAWGVKFGALAELLGADGQCRDVERAQYCIKRYEQAVEIAKLHPSVLETQINSVPIESGSLFSLDAFLTNWQNAKEQPQFLGMAGRNLLGLGNTPDAVYGVGLDLVRNMPVPATGADFLQVGRDMVDPILDYAQHLASFKMAGADFSYTMKLYQNFIRAAGEQNSRIRQAAFYNDALRQPATNQSNQYPRLDVPKSAQYETPAH